MIARQTAWPRQWLMTGDALWDAIARLPDGAAGIVFRHHETDAAERRALAGEIARTCRARGLTLAVARDEELARAVGAQLVHNPARPSVLPVSTSVHSLEEAERTRTVGAALVFVSPVHATRSHPGRAPLGPERAAGIARAAGVPAIALGGMDSARFEQLPPGAFHGWAAIDAWLG